MREATIHIPHDEFEELSVGAFVSRCTAAGLRDITELACASDGCLFVVTLDSELPEEELADVPGLVWWERLSVSESGVTYLGKVSGLDSSDGFEAMRDVAVSNTEIDVCETGIDVSVVGSQTAIARSVEEYNDAGLEVVLRRLTDYTGPETTLDVVTDRQEEILERAYDLGYFDVPRRASAAEVAAELGLDASTVTEHLRRAEHNLFSELFENSP